MLPKRPPADMAARYPVLTRLCTKPAEVVVDNASEFRGHLLEEAAKSCGFAVRFCKIKSPRERARGERRIGVVQRKFASALKGRIDKPQKGRKSKRNAKAEADLTIAEMEALLNHVVAEVNVMPNASFSDRPPALLYQRDAEKFGIDGICGHRDFSMLCMDSEPAVITKSGVRKWGLRFHHVVNVPVILDDLVPLQPRGERDDTIAIKGRIKFDPENIRRIWWFNVATRRYVELDCAEPEYADGLPLWLHEHVQAQAKAEGEAFNTKEERLAARNRRIQAIRNRNEGADEEETQRRLEKLYETPRIRAITGNIVHLRTDSAEAVSLDDFISHDSPAATSVDTEILSPRKPVAGPRRDSRDAGGPIARDGGGTAPRREARNGSDADRDRRDHGKDGEGRATRRPAARRVEGGYK